MALKGFGLPEKSMNQLETENEMNQVS